MNGHPQRWHYSQEKVQCQPSNRGAFYNGYPPRGPAPSRFGVRQMGHQQGFPHQQCNAVPSYPAGRMGPLPSYRFRPPGLGMPPPFTCPERSFGGPPGFGPRHQPPHFTGPRCPQNRQLEKKKKNKVAKQDLPENSRFFCDACDRGYKDEEKYKTHISEHQQCQRDGCTYVAAPKLVQLHVKLQHQSGLAKKIWSLESPEDIKKWKEERKKNFPTKENIERKKAVLADKIARGEIIEEKQFGHMRMHQRGRGRGKRQGYLPPPAVKHTLEKTPSDDGPSLPKQKKTLNNTNNTHDNSLGVFFEGTASGSGSDSSDEASDTDEVKKEDSTNNNEMASSKPTITAAGALGTLISNYSDSEEEVEKTDCDMKMSNEGTDYKKEKPNRNRQKNRGKKNKNIKWQLPPRLDKSLLEKLLAKEIRKERNQIMQCVYYIVKEKIF